MREWGRNNKTSLRRGGRGSHSHGEKEKTVKRKPFEMNQRI